MDKKARNVIDYIGSKNRLAPKIVESMEKHMGVSDGAEFVDLFAGTGAVSRWLLENRRLESITTNDIETYSAAVCLATTRQLSFPKSLYDSLNSVPGFAGFISHHCSPSGPAKRKFFTLMNAKRIDGMKFHIINMYSKGFISIDEMIKLIGELVIAADKVSNTASVYGAYLKKFKKTALENVHLKPMNPPKSRTTIWNFCMDAANLIEYMSGDVLYIDPPYNQRQYSDNYHVLNYIAEQNAEVLFDPSGVTGLPKLEQRNRSLYCNKKKVGFAIDQLLKKAKFDYIVFSYNNRGLLDIMSLKIIFEANAEIIGVDKIEYQNFKADSRRVYDADKTTEYIFTLRKK